MSWRSSAEFTTKRQRSSNEPPPCPPPEGEGMLALHRAMRSDEMSLKITRPSDPTRSSAPKPIRPSPQPTSRTASPGWIAARSRTLSRRRCRSLTRSGERSGPPWRRWRIQSAQQSSGGVVLEITVETRPPPLWHRQRGRAWPEACCPCLRGGFDEWARARHRQQDIVRSPSRSPRRRRPWETSSE